MRKGLSIVFAASLLPMVLSGCQQSTEANNPQNPYPPEEARENGDVVNLHGETSNLDEFESFVENVENGAEDEIRITKYTVEGDPVFYNLSYDGDEIQYTFDNSQDEYAGSEKGVESTVCSGLTTEDSDLGVEYRLNGCSSPESGNTFLFLVSE